MFHNTLLCYDKRAATGELGRKKGGGVVSKSAVADKAGWSTQQSAESTMV